MELGLSLSADGPLLAAALGDDGVLLIDVSDPTRPELGSRFPTPGPIAAVDVRDSLVFVGQGSEHGGHGALIILDASDPADPVQLAFRPFGNYIGVVAVVVRGQTAFLTTRGDDRFWIFDVSQPSSPVLRSNVVLVTRPEELRVDAYGHHAYVRTHLSGRFESESWVTVFDTSDRAHPVELSTFGYGTSDEIDFDEIILGGNRLYVAGWHWAEGNKLWVYDVSDPAEPAVVGEAELGASLGSLARLNRTLYSAGYELGTLIVDVTDPTAPELVGRAPTAGQIGEVTLADRVVALRTSDQLRLVELRAGDELAPLATRNVSPGFYPVGNDGIVARNGHLALTQDAIGLEIFDISDPAATTSVGHFPIDGYHGAYCAILHGDIAFVGVGPEPRLRVVDLSDPTAPSAVGWWGSGSASPCPLAADGDLLLSGSPCAILDIADPANPVQVGTCPASSSSIWSLALEGSTADLGSSDALRIYGLADPAHPVALGGTPIGVTDLDVQHGRVYVSRYWDFGTQPEIRVYDARDPAHLHLAGIGRVPREPASIAAERGRIVVAHGAFGSFGYSVLADCPFFADGFESGDTSGWSSSEP